MKDIEAFKGADREKQVAITLAEKAAEEHLIKRIKMAEAEKEASKQKAEEINIHAQAQKEASVKEAEARKILAEATAKEEATIGMSEAQVMHAKAEAEEKQGLVEATIIEKTAIAEAAGIEAKAEALKLQGIAEAEVIKEKALAEATGNKELALAQAEGNKEIALAEAAGIEEKAEAMKKLDGVGKDHEEFKLKLDKQLQVDLAEISIQKDIADAQADVIGQALKSSNIDIVGGETMFFDQIIGQITKSKGIDRLVNHSDNLTQVKDAILGSDDVKGNLLDKIKDFATQYGIGSEDIKNLTISKLLLDLQSKASSTDEQNNFGNLFNLAKALGLGDKKLN